MVERIDDAGQKADLIWPCTGTARTESARTSAALSAQKSCLLVIFASWLDFLLLSQRSEIAAEASGNVSPSVEWLANGTVRRSSLAARRPRTRRSQGYRLSCAQGLDFGAHPSMAMKCGG